jgi:hypothetical protein
MYSADKNLRAAAASLFLNYSVIGLIAHDFEGAVQSAGCMSEAVPNETDLEVMYRMALNLGNLMDTNADTKQMIIDLDFKFPADSTFKATTGNNDKKLRDTIQSVGKFYGLL